jgi:branched-subunit amino acid aminotransferase/4-amino-4-deoxychorismate lyase
MLARRLAARRGALEAIFLSTQGRVLEGSASNVFLIRRGGLVTPALADRILPGITRRLVFRIARSAGLGVSERSISPRELFSADHVLITNSLIEIQPVSHLDGRRLAMRRPDLVGALQDGYRKEVERYLKSRGVPPP